MKLIVNPRAIVRICIMAVLAASSFFILSFSASKKLADDFFKQLGISKTEANEKITSSILGGYLDQYGAKNAKNIALGNRTTVVKDLLAYTKAYVATPAFTKEYSTLRERNKPVIEAFATPDELQKETVDRMRKMVADMEANAKKADASMKKMYTDMLVQAKEQLKEAENPDNKSMANYRKNYPEMVKSQEASKKMRLEEWEKEYPADQLQFVKVRLEQFLERTADINFDAKLYEKNGRKYFEDKQYESKGNQWKMAYRAGKEVVEPSRAFVQTWLNEIK